MRKAWHIVSGLAMFCFLLGVLGIGVGFFTGSSPSALQAHGHLADYAERLALNKDIFLRDWAALVEFLRQTFSSLLALLGL